MLYRSTMWWLPCKLYMFGTAAAEAESTSVSIFY